MRILVTGGAGFIGSHVVDAYLSAGHEVHVADDLSKGRQENLHAHALVHEVDICSEALGELVADLHPEVINHHAAQASVKVSTAQPERDLAVNGWGTANVALAAARAGVKRLIYASSGGIYGRPQVLPATERTPPRPQSPYGVSKRAGEEYVRMVAQESGLTATIFRYGNVYGPRQDPRGEAGVIAIFAGLMLRGMACTIDGDGEQQKDYVYVGDIAQANLLALAGPGGVFNLGTGRGTSVNTLHRALRNVIGDTLAPVHGSPRAGDARMVSLDPAAAERAFGWCAATSLEEGLRRTVASLEGERQKSQKSR